MSEGNEGAIVPNDTRAVAHATEDRDEALEAGALAYQLAKSYKRYVDYYRTTYGVSTAEADAEGQKLLAPGTAEYEDRTRNGPPQDASWHDLNHLAANDPDAAAQRWLQIKAAARDELVSGHRAAKVMEGFHSDPWERAEFLAIRSSFIKDCRPANGIERALLDIMSQAHSSYMQWQKTLAEYASIEMSGRKPQDSEDDYVRLPRVSIHEAMEQAVGMVDRYNRLFLRTLRQWRDLRRYAGAVTIQQAGQVNIGGQQVNMAKLDEG